MKKVMFNDKYGLTKAVLEGRKVQTRRIIKPQPHYSDYGGICWKGGAYGLDLWGTKEGACANFISGIRYRKDRNIPFHVGDVVAVAQSYKDAILNPFKQLVEFTFGDTAGWNNKMFVKAEFMPHQLEIIRMELQRLQNITDEDCLAEGIIKGKCGSAETHFMGAYYIPNDIQPYCTPKEAYAELIDKISGKGTWDSNPWVWVYTFKLISKEEKK